MGNLGKVWKWIKKHWYIPSVFIFIVLIILPVILKTLFKVIISSDWLGYYGTCLATIGTAVLGTATVWQTSNVSSVSPLAVQMKKKTGILIENNHQTSKITHISYCHEHFSEVF